MKHFGLRAFQQFHISTKRIWGFSPFSSTFESFQLFFPLISWIVRFLSFSHLLFLLFCIHLPWSSAQFPAQHLLIPPSLSFCQSVYSSFQICIVFVFCSKLLWLLFSCIHPFSCLFHSCAFFKKVIYYGWIPVSYQFWCLYASWQYYLPSTEINGLMGGRDGWLSGMRKISWEWGGRDKRNITN